MSIPRQKIREEKSKENKSTAIKIKTTVLDELKQEAEQKVEDVNTLVNQILTSHIQWHKLAKKSRLVYISKDLMAKTIDYLSDEQIIQMTYEFSKQRFMDIMHMLREENTFACFMDTLCLWLDASGFHYRIETNNISSHSDDDVIKVYKIHFDMGRKWSLFFKTLMALTFEHYKTTDVEVKMTDNIVILKIKRKIEE
ncbi:MAG: hypothetical protein ACTHL3_06235 [Candidatus Nitrosocosmicus sp.]